jgi:hypothetical protein
VFKLVLRMNQALYSVPRRERDRGKRWEREREREGDRQRERERERERERLNPVTEANHYFYH